MKSKMGRNPFESAKPQPQVPTPDHSKPSDFWMDVQVEALWKALEVGLRFVRPKS